MKIIYVISIAIEESKSRNAKEALKNTQNVYDYFDENNVIEVELATPVKKKWNFTNPLLGNFYVHNMLTVKP